MRVPSRALDERPPDRRTAHVSATREVRLATGLALCLALATSGCRASSESDSEGPRRHPALAELFEHTTLADRRAHEPESTVRDLPPLSEASSEDDYVLWALLANPGLEAAFSDYVAALERVPQARSLPDPRISYRYYVEEVETRAGPQRQSFGLTQPFPWPGTLALSEQVSSESARALFERFEAEKLALVAEVRDLYHEHYYLGRAIQIVSDNLDLVRYLESVARVRYSAGAAEHPDVIRAQIELGRLEDRHASLSDRRGPIRARLNAALSRPITAELPPPRRVRRGALEVDDDRVLTWVGEHNPELRALDHEATAAEHEIELARKQALPDLALGVDLIDTGEARTSGVSGSGDDAIMVGLSMTVPLWRETRNAALREAEARLRAALKRREDRTNRLSAHASSALYRLRDAVRKTVLYEEALIPRAEQSLSATETAYRGGAATFSDLVDAEQQLLEFQLGLERALADGGQAHAELERITGRPLPTAPLAPAGEDETTESGTQTRNGR